MHEKTSLDFCSMTQRNSPMLPEYAACSIHTHPNPHPYGYINILLVNLAETVVPSRAVNY